MFDNLESPINSIELHELEGNEEELYTSLIGKLEIILATTLHEAH